LARRRRSFFSKSAASDRVFAQRRDTPEFGLNPAVTIRPSAVAAKAKAFVGTRADLSLSQSVLHAPERSSYACACHAAFQATLI
jgi:hypothetical protein